MIRMITSIRPSDMAFSPEEGRRMEIRRPSPREKHIPTIGSSEGTGSLFGWLYFGCNFSAAELMQ
jgi:hypothetical protein